MVKPLNTKFMKSNIIKLLIFIGIVTYSCTPDEYDVIDFEFENSSLKHIELFSNSDVLYANGENKITFKTRGFDIFKRELTRLVVTEAGDSIPETYEQIDTFLLKDTRIPEGLIKYYDENDNLLENPLTVESTSEEYTMTVTAKFGDLMSEEINITVRPNVEFEKEYVIPVIFQLVEISDETFPEINSEQLQMRLDKINNILNAEYSIVSNSGQAKIKFMLAEFDKYGKPLAEKGIYRRKTNKEGDDLVAFIDKYATFDPQYFMNVWVTTLTSNVKTPEAVVSTINPEDYLQGLDLTEVVDNTADVTTNIGLTMGARYSGGKYVWDIFSSSYEWEYNFASYLGLLSTKYKTASDLIDGDIDYCDDTFSYISVISGTFSKLNAQGNYYESENLMDQSSKKAGISVEQAKRMRWVLENCPSRWAWKSDFAFTGVK